MPDQKTTVTTPAAVKPPDTPKPTASKTPLPSVSAPPVENKPQEPKAPEKKPPVEEKKAAGPGKTGQKPQAENTSSKKPEQPEKPAPETKPIAAAEKKPEVPKAERPVTAPARGTESNPTPHAAVEEKKLETAAPAIPKPAPSPEKKPEVTKAEKAEKPTEPPQAAKGPAPLGVHITRIFDDRLDKPDENALKALPVPQEGEGFSMRLHPDYFFDFLDHPFSVNREVQDYKDLFESIKATGINEPVKARPREGGGLELLSGHRRHDIAKQLGYPVPVVIVQEDEDTARIEVVDGNLHRQDIPTSELARAAKMKMDALARKAGRRSKLEQLAQPQKRTDQIVAEDMGMSRNQVNRLVRINSLVPELKQQVDDKKLPFNTAVELSFLKPQEQNKVVDFMKKEQVVPSMAQATALKEASRAAQEAQKPAPQNPLAPAPKQPAPAKSPAPVDEKKIASIVKTKEPPEIKYTFTSSELKEYFPKDYQPTVSEVKRKVFDALDLQKRQKERETAKSLAKKGAER
ncbi:MAG: ParB/RepB/Spo0J family partition protein [Acutalibacter sp.]